MTLLLLSLTNSFGRVLSRSRRLSQECHGSSGEDSERILAQLRILSDRARLLRAAIALAALSVLLAALLIIGLFLDTLLTLGVTTVIAVLFILCLLSLIISLLLFIADINLSLRALWLEMPPEVRRPTRRIP